METLLVKILRHFPEPVIDYSSGVREKRGLPGPRLTIGII